MLRFYQKLQQLQKNEFQSMNTGQISAFYCPDEKGFQEEYGICKTRYFDLDLT